mgnify:CR=1 FL=1
MNTNTFNFLPEGWNDTLTSIEESNINKYINEGTICQGIVEQCDDNYNLHVNMGNEINGIMPRSEVEGINTQNDGLPKQNLCTGKVHKFVQFKIKGIDENNIPILSRKSVQQDAISAVKNKLKEGDNVSGIVKNITSYGAFIEIGGGVVGLAHIEDLSVARIKSPAERLKIGQKVNIGKVSLSYKENYGTWEDNVEKLKTGEKVKGIVRETEKNKNGIFIELTPNLVGMAEYKPGLKYGQKIDVYIKKIDYNKRKVKLFII